MKLVFSTLTWIFCLQTINAVEQGRKLFLVEAVKQNKTDLILWLLSEEANVNVQDDEGLTPLMHASMMNDIHIMNELLTSGADIHMRKSSGDDSGATALHLSVLAGANEAVHLLFDKMKNTNNSESEGISVLSYAVLSDNEDILKYLLDQGLGKLEKEDTHGLTAIHLAALLGKTSSLKVLIEKGMHVDLTTKKGETPLYIASKSGEYAAAEVLIKSGANINAKAINGTTALHAAAAVGDLKLVKLLVENNSTLESKDSFGRTPLLIAVKEGHFAAAEYLTNQGSNIYVRDSDNINVMHMASSSGNTQLINFFIKRNISVDELNQEITPLVVAAVKGHDEAVKLLIKNGADKNMTRKLKLSILKGLLVNNNVDGLKCFLLIDGTMLYNTSESGGKILLHQAAELSDESMIKYILDLMVKQYVKNNETANNRQNIFNKLGICFPCYTSVANIKDDEGRTALHDAAEYGNSEAINVLMNHGAFINIVDNKGLTALHVAASCGQTEVLKTLVQYLPNLNAVDNYSKTALFLSAEAGSLDSVKYLIDIGADASLLDLAGKSLLHSAAAKGHALVMQELLKIDQLKSSKINSKDMKGNSPAWYAIENGHVDTFSLLEINGAQIDRQQLCQALESDKFKLGGPKSYKNIILSNGFTADDLTGFYRPENNTQIRLSTKYLCFINRLDKEGKTALWYAVERQKWSIADKLEKAGGIIYPNVTILEAIQNNQLGFVKYLKLKGTSVQLKDEGYWPIIFLAALYGHTDIVEYLIQSGAGVDSSIPVWDWSPLHVAAWVGHGPTVKLLLQKGANVNKVARGTTALIDAKPSCQSILKEKGGKFGR